MRIVLESAVSVELSRSIYHQSRKESSTRAYFVLLEVKRDFTSTASRKARIEAIIRSKLPLRLQPAARHQNCSQIQDDGFTLATYQNITM